MAEVIANHPQVEHVTVIEINRGYFTVIRRCQGVALVLSNPKVRWFVDDGRRWLVRHVERRLDEVLAYAHTLHSAAHDPAGMEDAASMRRRNQGKRIMTDNNMASEWTR